MAETGFDRDKIDRYFRGECSDADESYIENVFCDNTTEKELKHLLARQYYDLLSEDDSDKKDLDHILYRINYKINTKIEEKTAAKLTRFKTWSLRIADMLILP